MDVSAATMPAEWSPGAASAGTARRNGMMTNDRAGTVTVLAPPGICSEIHLPASVGVSDLDFSVN